MNLTALPFDPSGAHDALFDQIERELVALTTAPLDACERVPHACVDEFDNDFLGLWSMPPPGAAGARQRTN